VSFAPSVIVGASSGVPAVLSQGLTMQSILEILVINVKDGTSKKTNQPYRIPEAQCVLRNQDGTVGAVGVLVRPQ
jgi:hypothetical protein